MSAAPRRGKTRRLGRWALAGLALDAWLGEPPDSAHPVALFGTGMRALERRLYQPTLGAGLVFTAVGVGSAASAGLALQRIVGRRTATAIASAVSIAGRMLAAEANAVIDAVDNGDLDLARTRVKRLVGRATDDLDGAEILRATIETVAENTVDAVIASLFWASVGGAPAVLAHRAVNTLDAMVGHRTDRYEHFGWASARADDLANHVPARVAAAAVAVLVPARAGHIWQTVQRDAGAHPSPNGGIIEAAVAAAIGVRLGGKNRYGDRVEDRGTLGDGHPPTVADARRAVRLTRQAGLLVAVGLAIGS